MTKMTPPESPSSPRKLVPPSLSIFDAGTSLSSSLFDETAHLIRGHSSKRSFSEGLHTRWTAMRSLESIPGLASLVKGDVHVSSRAAMGLAAALFVLSLWIGGGAWQAKCCLCARVSREKLTQHRGAMSQHRGAMSQHRDGPRHFVYVYDLGPVHTEGVQRLEPYWYSEEYDVERVLTEMLQTSNYVRTTDPHEASLFFVPFYSARYTLYNFRQTEMNMAKAVRNTSRVWTSILRRIRKDFKFFNQSNGRDHFGVLALDHGRCSALTYVHPSLYGEMFFVMFDGDKIARSSHAHPKLNLQFLSYSYERSGGGGGNSGGGTPTDRNPRSEIPSIPDIPCYMPGRDIVVPPFTKSTSVPLVDPRTGAPPRSIDGLFQVWSARPRGIPLVHHGHDVSSELLRVFQGLSLSTWEVGKQEELEAPEDLRRAVFCVVGTGYSQWSGALVRSILSGCIPVTFYRENDRPWEDELEWSSFSVNLDPDELAKLQPLLLGYLGSSAKVEGIPSNPAPSAKVEAMQRELGNVQSQFLWSGSFESGAEAMLLKRLRQKVMRLRHARKHMLEQAVLMQGLAGNRSASALEFNSLQ